MRLVRPALAALFLLAGCKNEKPAVPAPEASATAQAVASASPSASASPTAQARSVSVHDALYEFDYAYPVQAAVIADLRKLLDDDLAAQRSELAKEARDERAAAKSGGFEYRPNGRSYEWKVVTDLPAWLSMSTIAGSYTGGAHPNYYFDTLLWDKRAGQRRDPRDLFTSKEALSRAIRNDFCAALNRERVKRRGEQREPGGMFWDCIDPVGETMILGSSNGKAFNRIGILIAPYEAGPYAEGSYEMTLPVTPAVMALVKPEYRASFAAR
ncbi:MAG TPA: DUF4163 domain-containing protein [Novosphingobium sp.]|nr:DUF4163 domain-containing protein [Novosphingobium sp.]